VCEHYQVLFYFSAREHLKNSILFPSHSYCNQIEPMLKYTSIDTISFTKCIYTVGRLLDFRLDFTK